MRDSIRFIRYLEGPQGANPIKGRRSLTAYGIGRFVVDDDDRWRYPAPVLLGLE